MPASYGGEAMRSDWVESKTPQLVAQILRFTDALNTVAGRAASGLAEARLDALRAMAEDLAGKYAGQLAAKAAFRAAVGATQAQHSGSKAELRTLGRAANAFTAMTDAFRNAAGLTIRDTVPTPGDLSVVENLAVVGRPSGSNFLDWSVSAEVRPGIVWQVFSALGASGAWELVGATTRTDFLHEGAGAGVHRLYRVVATRGNRAGEPGNEAAVYG